MKLGKIVKHIEELSKCIIWGASTPNDEFKIIFEGYVFEIPKRMRKEYELIKTKNNDDSAAIAPITIEGGDLPRGLCTDIRITVVKSQ